MKKKPARQPRKIEVVEDAPVATKPARGKKAKPAPTAAPEAPAEPPTPAPEQNATDAKPAANKRKTKAEAKPEATTKSKRNRKQPSTDKKLSALDAASQILASSGSMNCKSLIDAMASHELWTSPGGKTPHATLYAAILREITTKGDESRFVKSERGLFARR